jgi:flagellar biosynthetic protein FliQ
LAIGSSNASVKLWNLYVAWGINKLHSKRKKHQRKQNLMSPNEAIDLVRDAILMSLVVGSPLLVIGMLVGLAIGLIQALTQIQDQTVSTVPKLVAMTLAIVVCLPWLTDRMLEYTSNLLQEIPLHMSDR